MEYKILNPFTNEYEDVSHKGIIIGNHDGLPEKVVELVYNYAKRPFIYEDIICCGNTPIEMIFYVAFCIVSENEYNNEMGIASQFEVVVDGKKYVSDFSPFYYKDGVGVCCLLECEGYSNHYASKEKVDYTNNKDYDLMMAGYHTIHFSGSQIVKDPLGCARKVCRFLEKEYDKSNG